MSDLSAPAQSYYGHRIEKGSLRDLDMALGPVADLADVIQRGILEFQFNPESLEYSPGVTWAASVIPGYSHRRLQYGGGAARTWALKLRWFGDNDDDFYVKDRCDFLDSLTLPEYAGDEYACGPHSVLFTFGRLVEGVKCKLTKLKVKYSGRFNPESLLPLFAECDVELEETPDEPVDYRTRRGRR